MSIASTAEYLLPWFSPNELKRGTQFEHLMCWWLVANPTLTTTASQLVKVVRWEEWPDRPGRDLGTDLVGWDVQGRLWAIQCKAYSPARLVVKSEVSQLVGDATAGSGGQFFGRIYITTSDGYTANARAIAEKNAVLLIARDDLDRSSVTLPWPTSERQLRSFIAGKPARKITVEPYEHQKQAVEQVVTHLASHERGQLLMACGTGKTLTALWIKERLVAALAEEGRPARVVVLLPSISLLAQTLHEWAANRGTEWKQLAVCSDSTAGSSRDDNFEDMEAVSAGFPVTTDRKAIRDFLRSGTGEQIIFCTYQSSAEVAAAAKAEKVIFDLVICDEAHRLAGQAGKTYASVLDAKAFRARRRLFMTATPKVFTSASKKKAADEGYVVASMDDPKMFGEVAHQLTFGEAIGKGLLTQYQVVIAVTTDAKAKELFEDNRYVGLDGRLMTATDLAAAIAVAKAAKRHQIIRAISFHSTIKRSKQVADTLERLRSAKLRGLPRVVNTAHVDGSMSAKERQRRLDRLRSSTTGFNLVANARCLTEGVDVPALDGVAFVDPRQSEVDIVQAVGRAIRRSPNKSTGTIIVPVVCSAEEAAEGNLDKAGHKKLRQVLWALRAHDAELAIEIDEIVFAQAFSAGNGTKTGVHDKIKIEFDGDDLKGFAAKIRTSVFLIGSPHAEWAERYSALRAYVDKHNRYPMQRTPGEEGRLATWVSEQRTTWKQGKLSPDRTARLLALQGWSWDVHADEWNTTLISLKAFVDAHNRYPSQRALGDEGRLAVWVSAQRRAIKKDQLPDNRILELRNLKGWALDPVSDTWETNVSALVSFYKQYNRLPIAGAAGVEGALARWLHRQRQSLKRGSLSPERQAKLSMINGWSRDAYQDAWEKNFLALQAFYAEFRRLPISGTSGDEQRLFTWISVQRRAIKKKTLSTDRLERLTSMMGWSLDPWAEEWERNFTALLEFRNVHKHWPRGHVVEEKRLARWLQKQRQAWKQKKLSAERVERLSNLGGWSWDSHVDEWERNFLSLKAFLDEHDRFPKQGNPSEEVRLARWAVRQRQAKNMEKLSTERVERLGALPGWVWQAKD